jgi:heptosyltransferase-2
VIAAPGKILVRAPNWVGDVVMATPALRALRRAHPRAHLALAAPAAAAGLFHGHPGCDDFLPSPAARGLRALHAHARLLARGGFDWAVLLPDSPRAALPAWWARIPVRAGYARDPLRRLLLNVEVPVPREGGRRVPISMVERYLRVTRALGCADAGPELELRIDAVARERVAGRLAREGMGAGVRYAVVTPGASFGSSKLWPADHFAAACDGLARKLDLRCVLAPGPGEEGVARAVAARSRTHPICLDGPVTTLAELAALVADAALVLTNDTGPRHVAVALSTPVVTVMGPTDPRHTQHLLERQRVLRMPVPCSPCHRRVCPIDHRCMTRLAPSRVVDAAAELLS